MTIKKINGKKGDKIVSVYWFAILFIVAAAIVYMVLIFYGQSYDIREKEADILAGKIARCISENGYLKEEVLAQTFRNDFAERCRLIFETEDIYGWRQSGQYYVRLSIYDFTTGQIVSETSEGNANIIDSCNKGKNSPVCLERSFYSLDKTGRQYKINIFSLVRKTEKNAQ